MSWPQVQLRYVAMLNNEALGEDTDPDYELQYIDIGNVDSSGQVHEVALYRFVDAPSRARRHVRHGDVIVSCVRTYLQAIAPIENPPDNLIVSTGFAVVRPMKGKLRAGFCKYALREPKFLAEVERRSVGISYPAINASDLAAIPIPAPSDKDQLAIADFLDRETARLDALVAAKQRVIDLLAEKRKALIATSVTRGLDPMVSLHDSGVPWLGEIPAHWEVRRVRHLISSLEQGWSPEAEIREPTIDEWGVLKLNAISQGSFDPTAAKTLLARMEPRPNIEVHQGDVLITRANTPSLVGDACFVAETRPKLMLCDLIYRLRVESERIDGRFLVHFFVTVGRTHPEMTARGTSNSMVKLSQEHIKDWWAPIPPLDEQRAIVAHIARETAKLDAVRAATERTIALLKERRAALIAAAVTGQIDVGAMKRPYTRRASRGAIHGALGGGPMTALRASQAGVTVMRSAP